MGKRGISKLLLSAIKNMGVFQVQLYPWGICQLPEFPAAAMICFTLGLTTSVQMQPELLV